MGIFPLGSIIISDKSSSYVNVRTNDSFLSGIGFRHYFVNHSQNYVNPYIDWIHTSNIENCWKRLKSSFSKYKLSVPAHLLKEYLDTFIFKQNMSNETFFDEFMSVFGIITLDFV